VGAAKAAEMSGEMAKARSYCEQIVAIAGDSGSTRSAVVEARAFLKKS
jgi:hypothetical protein